MRLQCSATAALLLCAALFAVTRCACGSSQQPLMALRSTRFGPVLLEAFPVSGTAGGGREQQQLWATVGHVSLLRSHHSGRVFRAAPGGGFSATLLLGSPADARALARAANWASGGRSGGATECQFVRPRLTGLACSTAVLLPEGFQLLRVSGAASTADLVAADATTVVVRFDSQGGIWSEAALRDLEARGELTCRLTMLTSRRLSRTVRLRSSEALNLTPELLAAGAAARCSQRPVDLLAVYNFRSAWPTGNLVARGRYNVTARGGVNFTSDGALLPGRSWLEIDTEGGRLTEHMRYGSRWSVFFMYRRPRRVPPTMRGSALFSVHRPGNRLACSILAWTSGPAEASVYGRVHNLAAGYAIGQRTPPVLDSRPGAWNRVGISFDGSRQTVTINGAAAGPDAATYRLASYTSFSRDGLRGALSVGLVRSQRHAMRGAFRCFGVARGFVRPEQFAGLFDKFCG